MHRLTRTVRFNLPAGALLSPDAAAIGVNGESGKPTLDGWGSHHTFEVRCVGDPDQETGYLINIKDIDAAVRREIVPAIARAWASSAPPSKTMLDLLRLAQEALEVGVESVAFHISPHLRYEADRRTDDGTSTQGASTGDPGMNQKVIVRQMFEFSAAHRLHVPSRTDDENRAIFGKCNNPAGHGHNYRVEPAVAVDPDAPLAVGELERIVDEIVIERFDHKHLNDQTQEFATEGGLNPSVENIAKVCFELLESPIRAAGGVLQSVKAWETDRTSCEYPA